MAVLSSAVIAAGVRAGQFVRYYETVAQLLATTDSLAVGEIVRTPKYEYECVSTGEHLTTAGGAKLKCLASPWVTPDQFGAPGLGNDETSYVMAAMASGLPTYLNRYYEVDNAQFPDADGVMLFGCGPRASGLKGRNASSKAILQTFADGQTSENSGHVLRDFGIIGYGVRGLAAVQLINSTVDTVHFVSGSSGLSPNYFIGSDSVVLETCFGNVFSNIQCGAGSTRSDFRVNACVLDTIVDMLYTNNTSIPHHIEIDQQRYEIADHRANGHGLITFNTATLQGARGYAVKVASTYSVKFHNVYLENVVGALLSLDCDNLYLDGCEINSNSTGHAVWLDQARGGVSYDAAFSGCRLDKPVVAGAVRNVSFLGCNGDGAKAKNVLFTDATYRISDATNLSGSSQTQISTVGERDTTIGGNIALKCSDGGKHTRLTVTEAGVVSAETAFNMGYVDHGPHSPVVSVSGASSVAWPVNAAITPITARGVGGTTPYVFSVVGDKYIGGALPSGVTINASTGEISGTPTETGTFDFRVRVTDDDGMTDDSRLITATVS